VNKLILPMVIVVIVLGLAGVALQMGWLAIPGLSIGSRAEISGYEKEETGPIVKLSPLIINLKDENGRSYLKTTIVLEVARKNQLEEVKKMLSLLTDMVIMTLSDKRLEELKQPESKENLKSELLSKMNQPFPSKMIKRVYFDEFLYE
jgi:flagellar FliL protein